MRDAAVVMAEGYLEMHETKKIAATIGALIENNQGKIVVDWQDVEWINPLAIGLLLHKRSTLVDRGGELKFCRMQKNVRKIFSDFGVEEFFENYQTLEDAIESFDQEWNDGQGGVEN